jgi:DNA topoisomerase-1
VSSHLRQKGLPREKVLATIVKLLETTLVRVGNNEYARTNQSFGLTTMRDRHTKVTGSTVRMEFQGKSGIDHQIAIEDARIARIVKRCQDLPGQELFQYVDDQGDAHDIGSGDVNDYLREISGHDSPPKIFAPGPEQPWPLRHYASAKISTRRRPPNATSRQQSSASPSG